MDRPKNKVGGLELNPPDRHRKKRTDADNPDGCLQACKADRWAIRRMMARVVLSPALNVLRSYGENRPMKTAPCRSDVHAARTHLQRVIFSKKISRSGYS
jgi:hypothetical protein